MSARDTLKDYSSYIYGEEKEAMSSGGSGADRYVSISGHNTDIRTLGFSRFRKKPVVIEAIQIATHFKVRTLEGTMEGNPGDWLIRGVEGELYPCKPGIFAKTYEAEMVVGMGDPPLAYNITFNVGDREVGKFYFDQETDKLCFEGDLSDSAQTFVALVLRRYRLEHEQLMEDEG